RGIGGQSRVTNVIERQCDRAGVEGHGPETRGRAGVDRGFLGTAQRNGEVFQRRKRGRSENHPAHSNEGKQYLFHKLWLSCVVIHPAPSRCQCAARILGCFPTTVESRFGSRKKTFPPLQPMEAARRAWWTYFRLL